METGHAKAKDHPGPKTRDPCNDAAVDVARDFLADRALKPATVQRVLSSSEIPGGICKIGFWSDGEVGEGTQIRRHQARVTIHDCLPFHNLPISGQVAPHISKPATHG